MKPDELLSQIAPPLDSQLAAALIAEFVSVERRYVLGDWEPATLDGGQFTELAARLLYYMDSEHLHRRKTVDECLAYIEDDQQTRSHAIAPRRTALHLAKVLRTIYKFRSQRGAVHIDPDYSANELDARLVIECVRWVMAEVLRVFWSGSCTDVAKVIREIVRFDVPAVLNVDGKAMVMRTDCTAEEEVLLLLHSAGAEGLPRRAITEGVQKSPASVTHALCSLASPKRREVIKRTGGNYVLTPNGMRRVLEQLSAKLVLA